MKNAKVTFGILLCTLMAAGIVSAALNPSAVYCERLGYEFVIEDTDEGEVGKCILPNDEEVDAWAFLRGDEALDYSYCAKEGYLAIHVEDPDFCPSCTACVKPDGTEIEVTEMMGLTYREGSCGDGVCGYPEDFETCPEDCPSGGYDSLCDGVSDGICDPECAADEDPDCEGEGGASVDAGSPEGFSGIPLTYIIVGIVLIVIILAAVAFAAGKKS